jgi:hypothetical protein
MMRTSMVSGVLLGFIIPSVEYYTEFVEWHYAEYQYTSILSVIILSVRMLSV